MASKNITREMFSVYAYDHPLVKVSAIGRRIRQVARNIWGPRVDFTSRHVSVNVNGGIETHVYELQRVVHGEAA